MTFEELLEKVKAAKNLHRVIINSGATYIGESFASDELLFLLDIPTSCKSF